MLIFFKHSLSRSLVFCLFTQFPLAAAMFHLLVSSSSHPLIGSPCYFGWFFFYFLPCFSCVPHLHFLLIFRPSTLSFSSLLLLLCSTLSFAVGFVSHINTYFCSRHFSDLLAVPDPLDQPDVEIQSSLSFCYLSLLPMSFRQTGKCPLPSFPFQSSRLNVLFPDPRNHEFVTST